MPFSLMAEVTSSRNFENDKAATTVAKITVRAKTIHMTAAFENTGVIRASSANASPANPATKTRPTPFLINPAAQTAFRRTKRSSESSRPVDFLNDSKSGVAQSVTLQSCRNKQERYNGRRREEEIRVVHRQIVGGGRSPVQPSS